MVEDFRTNRRFAPGQEYTFHFYDTDRRGVCYFFRTRFLRKNASPPFCVLFFCELLKVHRKIVHKFFERNRERKNSAMQNQVLRWKGKPAQNRTAWKSPKKRKHKTATRFGNGRKTQQNGLGGLDRSGFLCFQRQDP